MSSPDQQKEFEELVKTVDPQDYSELPLNVRPLVVRMVEQVALKITEFSGPLPPPDQLARYDKIIPGAAERILVMAEKQAGHRMDLEKRVVPAQINESGRGQIFAFAIAVVALSVAFVLTLEGHDAVGGAIGTTTVLGLVGTFIAGKWEQKASLNKKAPPIKSEK